MALDPISAGIDFVGKVIDKLFPDKTKAEELKASLKTLDLTQEFQGLMGQIQVNIEEAKSGKMFIAGWRPFIGWICGAGFAWSYVVGPLFYWVSSLAGHPTPIPTLSLDEMIPVLMGMLGLGGLRTFEKVKGAEGNRG
jgi:hypothetical protein